MRCFNVDDSNPDFFGYPAKKSTPKHQVESFANVPANSFYKNPKHNETSFELQYCLSKG